MRIVFAEVGVLPPALRLEYLDSIPEGQELFVERLVQRGRVWQCGAAYAVVCDGALVEFHVARAHASCLAEFYDAALVATGAGSALVKSFDTVMRSATGGGASAAQELGILFRRVDPAPIDAGLRFRRGGEADVSVILNQDDGFFDGPEELRYYVVRGGLFVAERDGALVGCGLALEVVAGRNDVDVGMWVAPSERGRGFGASIVSHVIRRQLEIGRRPIAGCDVNNVASRKALERAGLSPDHRLLSVTHRRTESQPPG